MQVEEGEKLVEKQISFSSLGYLSATASDLETSGDSLTWLYENGGGKIY